MTSRDGLLAELPPGGLLLVMFAGSWCEACAERLARLTHWRSTAGADRVRVVIIGAAEDTTTTRAWLARLGVAYDALLPDPFSTIATSLGAVVQADAGVVYRLPFTVGVARSGRMLGAANERDDLITRVEVWVAEAQEVDADRMRVE